MLLAAFEAFRSHARQQAPFECCGVIVGEDYVPCRNIAEDPAGHFRISPEDLDAAEDGGAIRAICHSHAGPARPSLVDLERCGETEVPWFIIGAEAELQRVDPAPIPLIGRPFDFGWSDCWSLARDFFGDLPDFPREPGFWRLGHSPFEDHFAACGFRPVPVEQGRPGDALLMRVGSRMVPNHVGVLLDQGVLLHHPLNQLSRKDLLGPYLSHITHVLLRDR